MSRVLIVDDERNMLRILSGILASAGHETVEAESLGAAKRALDAGLFDVVLTDQRMPDGDGLELLGTCQEIDPALPVVVITAHASVELAVEAMRRGAFDFLAKPFHPDQVVAVVARAGERSELVRENATLRGQVAQRTEGILAGESPAIRTVRDLIARVGPTPATVLITGETGTGKELVARALHAASPRASRPLVAANCAAFAESLLDSELFGHERGAFTGADRARTGLFESAHRGTLFLDEAGEMSLALQAKLLRAVTTGEVVRVGPPRPDRWTSGCSSPPIGTCCSGSRMERSGAISTTASPSYRSTYRRYVTGSKTCRCWSRRCSPGSRSSSSYRSGRRPAPRWPNSAATPSPGTCASCATCWSARPSSPADRRSSPRICHSSARSLRRTVPTRSSDGSAGCRPASTCARSWAGWSRP